MIPTGEDTTAVLLGRDGPGKKAKGVSDEIIKERSMAIPNVTSEPDNADRRSAVRFPIEQDVRYKVFNRNTIEVGGGRTVNMSSNGLLFTTERALAPGERLEVAVNWPAQLDNKCPLKLVTIGRVIRSEGGRAAIEIDRYEFRTQGSHGMM